MNSITVYCSSSSHLDPDFHEAAVIVGTELAKRGITLVYGGGCVGLMGEIARAARASGGKVIGIICHGGLVAISAGIVKGRSATGSLGIKDDLVNAGANWVDAPAFRDANQVWGRVVEDIPDFCRELVAALTEKTNH